MSEMSESLTLHNHYVGFGLEITVDIHNIVQTDHNEHTIFCLHRCTVYFAGCMAFCVKFYHR